jgi:ESS family glutamate:Na+ symporter
MIENVFTLKFDMITVLALAIMMLMLGYWLRKTVPFLSKFCIPAPVIGGFLFSLVAFALKTSGVATVVLDTTFQSPFMIAFFTTVGLGASFGLVKKGGKILVVYWLLCGFLAIAQNTIGVVVAKIVGIHPILGIMAGAVSMEGGHGAAAAFGPTAEALGITGATTVALAAATFGLISGGLIGGPVARYLIEKNDLKPNPDEQHEDYAEVAGITQKKKIDSHSFLVNLGVITVCMAVGTFLSGLFATATGLSLPGYVGAMFVAVIFRNLNDKFKIVPMDMFQVDLIGGVSLGIFLSMALMNLKLWELSNLALPMFAILLAQVVFIILYAVFVAFRLLGKNFDAAIMISGLLGHGLGATPNAMANMGSVSEKYGYSTKAFLIVPLVGAFLIDLIGIPTIVWFINFFS